MLWLFVVAYLAVGYYYFWSVVRNLHVGDAIDTAIVCATFAITLGPLLLVVAVLFNWIAGAWKDFNEQRLANTEV